MKWFILLVCAMQTISATKITPLSTVYKASYGICDNGNVYSQFVFCSEYQALDAAVNELQRQIEQLPLRDVMKPTYEQAQELADAFTVACEQSSTDQDFVKLLLVHTANHGLPRIISMAAFVLWTARQPQTDELDQCIEYVRQNFCAPSVPKQVKKKSAFKPYNPANPGKPE
jgi:hypothetical protein